MRQSIYIAISLLVILLVTGCADKERQSAPDQEDYIATSTEQGMTVNDPEPSGETSEESVEEPENPFTPHSTDLLSEEEKEQLQNMALSAAESVKELYKDSIVADTAHYSSGVSEFSSEQRKAVVEQLGNDGLVSVAEDTNMQNPEKVEAFYKDYLNGQDSMVTVFDVQRDGLIGAVTFVFRKGQLQAYYIGIQWKECSGTD